MLSYLIRRLLGTLLVLCGVAVLAFTLIHAIPGTPWDSNPQRRALSNARIDAMTMRYLDQRFGLDLPLPQQLFRYLIGWQGQDGFECGFICGNLGPSMFQRGRTIRQILFQPPENGSVWESRFGYTLRLAGLAFLLTLAVGLPVGIWGAVRRNSLFDLVSSLVMAVSMSIPNFVLGLLLIVLLASNLHWISVRPDWSDYRDWIVPATALALAPAGMLARVTRTAVLDALRGEYVRTARSKGLDEQTILTVHVLKNAAIPLLTHLGPVLFDLIAASFVVEVMFGFPGFGREYYESITRLDYSMMMSLTLLYGVFIAFANLLTDGLYAILDPRIRLG